MTDPMETPMAEKTDLETLTAQSAAHLGDGLRSIIVIAAAIAGLALLGYGAAAVAAEAVFGVSLPNPLTFASGLIDGE